ncbi:MAG: prepilin-type N-terminal cleavage/methylation domain-containing protein [Deltaproteobacteria bacterium]|nr:prepilin-type N-terminal cleavage/methylation domain-containing protein [Deltaproteobacteria bacterium]
MNNNRGFTIIEMMTVIAIIGILATIAAPSFQRSVIRAKEASLRNSLFVLRDVLDQYYADHGDYPESLEVLTQKKYIRNVPEDPFTRSEETWIFIPPEGEGLSGIYDIHSGSNKISLYGTPYNEW